MEQPLSLQFQRVSDSIQRLTHGTPFEGTSVVPGDTGKGERLVFRTVTPSGGSLIDCYQGILLSALEAWSDDSLDSRMYAAAGLHLRQFLNQPPEVEAPVEEEEDDEEEETGEDEETLPWLSTAAIPLSSHRMPLLIGCPECRDLLADMQRRTGRLKEIARQAGTVSRSYHRASPREFMRLLSRHLQIQRELRVLHEEFALHRHNHSPEQGCRELRIKGY